MRGKIRDIRLRRGASLQTIKTADEEKERSEDSEEAYTEESKDRTLVRSKVDVNKPMASKHEAQNSSENALRRRWVITGVNNKYCSITRIARGLGLEKGE